MPGIRRRGRCCVEGQQEEGCSGGEQWRFRLLPAECRRGRAGLGTLFRVEDTDAAVARAVAAGGKAGTPRDNPYGRLAQITDPFGTTFQVGGPSPSPR